VYDRRVTPALLLAATLTLAAAPPGEQGRLLALVNEARLDAGAAPLIWDAGLADMAQSHAVDMAREACASHASPNGDVAVDRAVRADLRLTRLAENVGEAPDLGNAHEALMESKGHRTNILDPELSIAGFGVVLDETGRAYVVEDFGEPAPAFTPDEAAHEALSLVVPKWARRADAELSHELERYAQRLAATDAVRPDPQAMDACWMLVFAAADPREIPAGKRPGCVGDVAGAGVAWARTPTRPLGAFFVAIALRK